MFGVSEFTTGEGSEEIGIGREENKQALGSISESYSSDRDQYDLLPCHAL
jgi:hypothetical protein